MRDLLGIVLAGGAGERLKPLTTMEGQAYSSIWWKVPLARLHGHRRNHCLFQRATFSQIKLSFNIFLRARKFAVNYPVACSRVVHCKL
jgi:hypothetical protein